jgi:hypothetical protein
MKLEIFQIPNELMLEVFNCPGEMWGKKERKKKKE